MKHPPRQLNYVFIIARVCKTTDYKRLDDGRGVFTFTVESGQRKRHKNGKPDESQLAFIECRVKDKRVEGGFAEKAFKEIQKNDWVVIQGKWRQDRWRVGRELKYRGWCYGDLVCPLNATNPNWNYTDEDVDLPI